MEKVGAEVLGNAAKVVLTKDTTTIVGDGTTEEVVKKRVEQIKNLIEVHLKNNEIFRLFVYFAAILRLGDLCRLLNKTTRRKSSTRELLNYRVVLL